MLVEQTIFPTPREYVLSTSLCSAHSLVSSDSCFLYDIWVLQLFSAERPIWQTKQTSNKFQYNLNLGCEGHSGHPLLPFYLPFRRRQCSQGHGLFSQLAIPLRKRTWTPNAGEFTLEEQLLQVRKYAGSCALHLLRSENIVFIHSFIHSPTYQILNFC